MTYEYAPLQFPRLSAEESRRTELNGDAVKTQPSWSLGGSREDCSHA